MVQTLARKGFVYAFGGGGADGDASMKDLLGGKGANLAEMSSLGLPVPPGFTITTEACTHFYANQRRYPGSLREEVSDALTQVERLTGKEFGDAANPLLVSVRSGARKAASARMAAAKSSASNAASTLGSAAVSAFSSACSSRGAPARAAGAPVGSSPFLASAARMLEARL